MQHIDGCEVARLFQSVQEGIVNESVKLGNCGPDKADTTSAGKDS
jgi:hypothetical protein